MRKLLLGLLILGSVQIASARGHSSNSYGQVNNETVHVDSYTKRDGTYVNAYEKTKANDTKADNYSTKGNVNPYTGVEGTK